MPIYHRTNICLNVKLFPLVAHIIDAAICMCLLPIKKKKEKKRKHFKRINRPLHQNPWERPSEIQRTSVKKKGKKFINQTKIQESVISLNVKKDHATWLVII